jgi:hypothetical protein
MTDRSDCIVVVIHFTLYKNMQYSVHLSRWHIITFNFPLVGIEWCVCGAQRGGRVF